MLRKGYGLGAQAMAGGGFKAPLFTVAWPTSEFGGMGLEGAVRLGMRRELEAIEDADERERVFQATVAAAYEHGRGLNMAAYGEIDDVIDPADSRRWIATLFGEHRFDSGGSVRARSARTSTPGDGLPGDGVVNASCVSLRTHDPQAATHLPAAAVSLTLRPSSSSPWDGPVVAASPARQSSVAPVSAGNWTETDEPHHPTLAQRRA